MRNLLLIGSSGQVGQAIQQHFQPNGNLRLITTTRNPEHVHERQRFFDFEQVLKSQTALQDIHTLFLLRPPQIADVDAYFVPLIKECIKAGIQHLLFLSVQGADRNRWIPHAKIEDFIRRSGLPYTFFRPSYFMQNLTTTLRKDIVEHDHIFLPAGKAPFLWVDVADIGRAIARVLEAGAAHHHQTYTLTGKELWSFPEVADLLSTILGRPIHYRSPSLLRFYRQKRREGINRDFIFVLIMLHYFPRFQSTPQPAFDLEHLTGKAPTGLRTFLERAAVDLKSSPHT